MPAGARVRAAALLAAGLGTATAFTIGCATGETPPDPCEAASTDQPIAVRVPRLTDGALQPLGPAIRVAAAGNALYVDYRTVVASWPREECVTRVAGLGPVNAAALAMEVRSLDISGFGFSSLLTRDDGVVLPLRSQLAWLLGVEPLREGHRDVRIAVAEDAPFAVARAVLRSLDAAGGKRSSAEVTGTEGRPGAVRLDPAGPAGWMPGGVRPCCSIRGACTKRAPSCEACVRAPATLPRLSGGRAACGATRSRGAPRVKACSGCSIP